MDEHKIRKRTGKNNKVVMISIRITKALSNWLKAKGYSQTGIFMEAVKELGYKEDKTSEVKQNKAR